MPSSEQASSGTIPPRPRSRRFARRRGLRLVAIVIVLLALIIGVQRGLEWYAQRQINGPLTFDAVQLPDHTHTVGTFVLTWSTAAGGQLSIYHHARPEKILWASLPGRSFVATARGAEQVEEARGMFFFHDRLLDVCDHQHIEQIAPTGNALTISGQLRCGGQRQVGYTLTFTTPSPNQLRFDLTLNDPHYNRTYLTYASQPDEHFFGFGEQFSFFDLKGKRLPLFASEQGIGRGLQPLTFAADVQAKGGGTWYTTYMGVPHYITSQLRSLFLETYEYAVFDLRRPDRVHIQLWGSHLAGRIVYGESPAELIREYSAYAGRMRPLPDWIHSGAVVGLQGGMAQVRQVLAKLKAQGTPIAAVWLQDWVGQRTTSFGKRLWWNWELDQEHYPEWKALVADLHAEHVRVLTYVNPFLVDVSEKPNARRNLFKEASAQGYLIKHSDGTPYLIQQTDFAAALMDLTNPAARAWLKDIIREQMLSIGVDGWMADFGEGLPYDARLFSGANAAQFHNQYPEAWARLNREVIDASDRGDEQVFFMRTGYRHSPGAATLFWTGDQLVTWDAHDGIKTAVIGLLSSGMSGFSLNHPDIGGYTSLNYPLIQYHRSKELLLRWIELGTFTPVFRSHESNRPDENIQVYSDDETLAQFSRFAKVYAAWADYRRTLVREAAESGLPVVRHPFIHYPNDPQVYGLSYQQFMVGSELMVAPVLDPGRNTVDIYLPAGRWVHLWSGQTYGATESGTWVTIAAPLGQPAVFYRAGSPVGAQLVEQLRAAGVLP